MAIAFSSSECDGFYEDKASTALLIGVLSEALIAARQRSLLTEFIYAYPGRSSSFHLKRFACAVLGTVGKTCKTKIMSRSTLSTKGQLVIPARFRKALNLRAGDKVEMTLEGRRLILQRESPRAARLRRGKFGRPVLVAAPEAPAMTTESVNALVEERP